MFTKAKIYLNAKILVQVTYKIQCGRNKTHKIHSVVLTSNQKMVIYQDKIK